MKSSVVEKERRNVIRSRMKKSIRALKSCKTRAEAENLLNDAVGSIDKASQMRVIHKNKAARDKSKLMSFVNSLSG